MAHCFKKLLEFNPENISYKEVLLSFFLIVSIVGFNVYILDTLKGIGGSLVLNLLWLNLNFIVLVGLVYFSIKKLYREWIQNRTSQLWKKLTLTFLGIFSVPFLFLLGVAVVGQSSYLRVFTDNQLKEVYWKLQEVEKRLKDLKLSADEKKRLLNSLEGLKGETEELRKTVRQQKLVLINYTTTFLLIGALVIFGSVVAATFLANLISREVKNLSTALKTFAKGNFNVRLEKKRFPTQTVKELLELVNNFNLAVSRTELLYRQLESESKLSQTIFEKVSTPIAVFYKKTGKLFKANPAYKNQIGLEDLNELKKFVEDKENFRLEEIPLGGLTLVVVEDLTDYIYAKRYRVWKEVASRLAHDIKNPLHGIQISTETLALLFQKYLQKEEEGGDISALRKMLKEKIPQEVANIKKSIEYVNGLINSFNTLTSEEENLNREWFSLRSLLLELKRTFDSDKFRVLVEVGPFYLYGDKAKLRRVFENLIRNSYEAVQKTGGGWIRFKTEKNLIHIWDNGPGIPSDSWDTVFLPFSSTKAKGRGLGLFIAKKFIDEHGWSIKLAPPLGGKGAHFVIEVKEKDFKTSLR